MKPLTKFCCPIALLLLPATAGAHETGHIYLEEVLVQGKRINLAGEARSASEGIIGQQDLELRALQRPGDILEAIPGLIVTQHSGSGKSNQMFLRGFNLDHGTDFATWIDGMPVNMRTHGHGQGYTDINFLIPETIAGMSFVKGPYHAELGDFSSAGGAHIRLFERMPDNQVQLGAGENGYGRLFAMGGVEMGDGHLSGALETQVYDGPWTDIEEDVEKLNGLLRFHGTRGDATYSVTGMIYDNRWNSADQVPARAVKSGLIDDLGSIDDSLGGDTRRASLSGTVEWQGEGQAHRFNAYGIDYEMNLWSNFTYRLDDPVNGDQFQQVDNRRLFGAAWHGAWTGRNALSHRGGLEWRFDDIGEVGLHRSQRRQRLDTVRQDQVEEHSVAAWYELEWSPAERWRAVLGLRGDYYSFDVDASDAVNSGSESESIFSPKASLIYALGESSEVYLSGGYGFHSNDARGTTIQRDPASGAPAEAVDPLVESRGAEIGLRTGAIDGLNVSLALWYLELDSELLFVGDAGNTEASRPSRRMGIEFNNFWQIDDTWSLEADFALTDAEYDDSDPAGRDIPGALSEVVTLGVTAEDPAGWYASLRMRYFGEAPLVEDDSVRSGDSLITNLALGWRGERWRVQLDILNALDAEDNDIEYFYASRLPDEGPEGVEDVHFHRFEPRQARLYLTRTW